MNGSSYDLLQETPGTGTRSLTLQSAYWGKDGICIAGVVKVHPDKLSRAMLMSLPHICPYAGLLCNPHQTEQESTQKAPVLGSGFKKTALGASMH